MKDFEFDANTFSKREIIIGGVRAYLYNADVLEDYIVKTDKNFKARAGAGSNLVGAGLEIPIKVNYLLHYRGGDYKFTESVAYNVLKQYYDKGGDAQVPLVCVTFDNRNHGERTVDPSKNSSWKSGNTTHGLDMLSAIHGSVEDAKLIIDYLPGYLNLDYFIASNATREDKIKIKYNNIMSGYSVGGHSVIRFANRYPHLVTHLNPVIGCNELTTLLINRLLKITEDSPDFDKHRFYFNYDELNLTDEQKRELYPQAFHQALAQEDTDIFENFPFKQIKVFACFGQDDKLVPPRTSSIWIDMCLNSNNHSQVFVQDGVGHDVTPDMIDNFTTWLVENA